VILTSVSQAENDNVEHSIPYSVYVCSWEHSLGTILPSDPQMNLAFFSRS